MNIIWKGSPNFDTNRKPIKKIVIHWIVGNLAAADAVFSKTTPGTSAHYGVEDGTIYQYVDEKHVAYHAGVYLINQESIGIEHSAAPDRPASEQTYQTSGKLIAEIAKRHSIPLDRQHIIGHKEVKATQCPGTIDIDKLIRIAKGGVDDMTEREEADRNWTLTRTLVEALGLNLNGDNPQLSVSDAVNRIRYLQNTEKELAQLKAQPQGNSPLVSELRTVLKKILG